MNSLMDGEDFQVERNGRIIYDSVKGFFDSLLSPTRIHIPGDYDIRESDWLVWIDNKKRYFICNINYLGKTDRFIQFKTEYEYTNQKQPVQYNIGAIHGSAIVGNQQNATINIGHNLDDIKKHILSSPNIDPLDKDQFDKLIERLKIIIEDNQPVSKGTLAKFSDLLAKHSDVAVAFGKPIIKWLCGKY